MARDPDLARFERTHGIFLPEVEGFLKPEFMGNIELAMDAQPALITTSNAGIPAFLANWIDPKLIQVLVAPNKAAKILGEVKKGDWTTMTAMFPVIEYAGETTAYGDFNEVGTTDANPTFPQRQSFHYQTMTRWGERQMDWAALAKIDWAARINIASVMVLDKFQNNSYFFGIGGLQTYGLINDPNLTAPLTPSTKAAGGVRWIISGVINATANEIFADIQSMYYKLTQQANGLISPDAEIKDSLPIKLVMSPGEAVALTATNAFGVNVKQLLKDNFPGITIETAPQYSTAAGELVQMIVSEVEGQETGYAAFTEKLRAHPVIRAVSSFKQKKSQGTFGAVILQPFAIAQMLGV